MCIKRIAKMWHLKKNYIKLKKENNKIKYVESWRYLAENK